MEEENNELKTSDYIIKQTSEHAPSNSSVKMQMEYIPQSFKHSTVEMDEFWKNGKTSPSTSGTKISSDKDLESSETPDSVTSRKEHFSEMALVAEYDEIIRIYEDYYEYDLTEEFISFAEHQELCRIEWLTSVTECRRLQADLDRANHEIGDFANKLKNARRLLDQEKRFRRRIEEEKINLEQQMFMARELLFNEKGARISDDTKEKLSFLNNSSIKSHSLLEKNIFHTGTRLNTISEVNSADINSTASLLSDFSYSRSDGELDSSTVFKMKTEEWKKPQQIISKKSKSPRRRNSSTHKLVEINPSDKIVATTTLAVSKDGPITATSIIEAVPQSETESESSKPISPRPQSVKLQLGTFKSTPAIYVSGGNNHSFVTKTLLYPETCISCKNKIRFGKVVAKCKECRIVCHIECKNNLPFNCVAQLRNIIPELSEIIPNSPPLVPPALINCLNEIEIRGLREVGLYRISGNEKEIKSLKDKLIRGKIIPNLKNIDVHVLCGVVKDILRSLSEPLVSNNLRDDFIQSAEAVEEIDAESCLYQTISQLPPPNRDTLAYVMLHLNRVAASRYCKMPASNLSKIFGPTIVGYSSRDIESNKLLIETKQQVQVMECLMKIPVDFWSSLLNIDSNITTPRSKIFSKISTPESLAKSTSGRRYFTPEEPNLLSSGKKKKKYFNTPPSYK